MRFRVLGSEVLKKFQFCYIIYSSRNMKIHGKVIG
jgi:hypothetical protein